jgi:hypothetical protein
MKSILITLCLLLFMSASHAFTMNDVRSEPTQTIEDYIKDFVDIPDGGIDWRTFGTTKSVTVTMTTEEGYENQYSQPEFQPEVLELDGKEIRIKGYMFPLEQTEKQKLFLFGPFPLSCPFQYHVGPSLIIEVHADNQPISFDYEPITIVGTLELVANDPEYSVFYRLKGAKQDR